MRIAVAALASLLLMAFSAFATDQTVKKSDAEWRTAIEPLLPLGATVARTFPPAQDRQLRAEMLRMIYSDLGAGFLQLMHADPRYPDFIPNQSQVFNNAGNLNPDAVYYLTPLDDKGVYRISGYRGSVHIVDMQVGDSTTLAYGRPNAQGNFGPTFANYDLDEFHVGPDGAFEFILSPQRPEGYGGDWRLLPAHTNYMMVRQIAYDWLHEVDARLAIERLDLPAAKPRKSAEQIYSALQEIPKFTQHWMKMILAAGNASGEWGSSALYNKVVLIDYSKDQAGRASQRYISSRFDVADDEALILEMAPGKCRFWNIHLGNELLNTLDFMHRQVSLNGFTARPDADGRYRIVVSSKDPGVPNWLDTEGYRRGFVWGRLDTCENTEAPQARKIKLADLGGYLPADTVKISAEERDAAIRLRRKGAQLRRRW